MFCDPCKPNSSISIDKAREFLAEQDDCVVLSPESLNFTDARKLIGDAFGGNSANSADRMTMAMLGPLGLGSDDKSQERQELTAFSMGFFVFELLQKGGLAMGIRQDGSLRAAIVFREYNAAMEDGQPKLIAKIKKFVLMTRAYFKMKGDPLGLPKILVEDKEFKKKFSASFQTLLPLVDEMRKWHGEYGPKEPHWYVGIVGSDPESQGNGYCKQAMNLLARAADANKKACYLECVDKNRAYYEKFGFEVTEHFSLPIGKEVISGCLMTRLPK